MAGTTPIVKEFPEWGAKELWKRDVGGGYSGLLHSAGRIFTAFRDGDSEVVAALSAEDGETAWEYRYQPTAYPDMEHAFGDGPSATPLIVDGRLFMISIDGQMRCFATGDGELLWELDLHERYGRQTRKEEYGFTAPPMAYGEHLLVAVGGEQHGVVALDPATGEHLWGSPPSRVSYAGPVIIDVEGHDQFVFFAPTEVIGMNPGNGEFLWRYHVESWTENNLTPALHLGGRHLWVAGQLDAGTRVLRLPEPGTTGDPEVVWELDNIKQAHWSSFVDGEYVYGSVGGNFSSSLTGIHWPTGEIAWTYRGFHLVKGVMVDEVLYFLDENGQVGTASFSPEGVEIFAANQLLDRVSWTIPIVVDDVLYARNQERILAVSLNPADYEKS
ncbi:hypothetical protein ABI59_17735 [Acidobacteria bacterium Mor1]|nr:hypothetical protein ABI59_17735 [Acidobacteria bacterium Mor1]